MTWFKSGFEPTKGSDGIARQNAQKKMHHQPTQDRTQIADDPSTVSSLLSYLYDIFSLITRDFVFIHFNNLVRTYSTIHFPSGFSSAFYCPRNVKTLPTFIFTSVKIKLFQIFDNLKHHF